MLTTDRTLTAQYLTLQAILPSIISAETCRQRPRVQSLHSTHSSRRTLTYQVPKSGCFYGPRGVVSSLRSDVRFEASGVQKRTGRNPPDQVVEWTDGSQPKSVSPRPSKPASKQLSV